MTVSAFIHFFFLFRSDCRVAFRELPGPCPLELPGPELEPPEPCPPEPCPLELPGPEFELPLEELAAPLFEGLDVPVLEPGVTVIPELPGLRVVPPLPFPCIDPPLEAGPVPEDELPEFPVDAVVPLGPPGDELVPAPEPEDEPVPTLPPPAETPPPAEGPPSTEAPPPVEGPPPAETLADELARVTSWFSVRELLAP
jgi:hypothetical protein